MWLLVGLGNPGPAYARTRHNLGARVIERMAERSRCRLKRASRADALAAECTVGGERAVLAFPTTYMNASGPAVAALARRYRLGPGEILVASDDLYLPLGRMRIRAGGGDGGHNGLASVSASLGTKEFPRLRLGIGEPPSGIPGVEWVLRPFDRDEVEAVEDMIDRACDALELLVREGLVRAMDLANRRPDEGGRKGETVGTSL